MKRHEPTIQSLSRKHKKKNKQLSNKRIRHELDFTNLNSLVEEIKEAKGPRHMSYRDIKAEEGSWDLPLQPLM